jgi:hypothetical protein
MKPASEDSRRHQRTPHRGRGRGAAGQPKRLTGQPLLVMSVLYRLKDCIYAVLLSRFDPRVQN